MDDRSITNEALELLETLEQQHRHDLTLHLYSIHLLKQLLRKANRRKRALETEVFIKTMIKDNWTSWPSPNIVIDPHVDRIYEDENFMESSGNSSSSELEGLDDIMGVPDKGEISPLGLKHATKMLSLELNSVWQRNLAKSGALVRENKDSGINLDIDKINIPQDILNNVLMRLDTFVEGLHTNFAKQTKLALSAQPSTSKLVLELGLPYTGSLEEGARVSELGEHLNSIDLNRKVKFDYRDIIVRGCEMELDMSNVYIKCLELFEEVPTHYNVKKFKIPKDILQKYMPKQQTGAAKKPVREVHKDYWELTMLSKDRNLDVEIRKALRLLLLHNEFSKDKKTFMMVQMVNKMLGKNGNNENNNDSSDSEGRVDIGSQSLSEKLSGSIEFDEDAYDLDDCLIR
ncbi:HGR074Cp [Eremothecium sinecaudum]|uniref:HGR074Cp n=1 Tax=Eremothecium sinecaudum TaxID=45286 RepID=A0A109V0T5_9SACH|nr:HGR074Cp [Eremothecium sinecaudum]AMD22413.1 HGR074Cp [Eremothecium sinecaudum]